MRRISAQRPSPAIVVALVSLFCALSGTAWAVNGPAPGINSVGTSDIINQEVKGADIRALAVGNGKIAANAVTSAKVLDNSLTGADINESTLSLNVSGGPCPAGQFVRNLSSGAALTCGPTTSNSAFGVGALQANTFGNSNSAFGDGALSANTEGLRNTAVGYAALFFNTTGHENSAVGQTALLANTTGSYNSALGQTALAGNTTGVQNSAVGDDALVNNTTGFRNSALGESALVSNTTGTYNSAFGRFALSANTTGYLNTALGEGAGQSLTTGFNNIVIDNTGVAGESDTIRIGDTQTSAYLAGVFGATAPSGVPVYITSGGHLGTGTSSRRFKRDIRAIGAGSDRLMKLRPVSFHYKRQYLDGSDRLQYGLIAEEVAKVYPSLVAYGRDGKPYTVRYQELPALLLNEAQRQQGKINALQAENGRLQAHDSRLQAQVDRLMRHAGLR